MRLGRFTPTHVARRLVVGAGRRTVALGASLAARDTPEREVQDARRVPIGDELVATAYWIDRPEVGRGPAVSITWRDQELLRIDLFDARSHVHYGLAQMRALDAAGASVKLPPVTSCDARADRAVFEVEHNLHYAVTTHPSRQVRNLRVTSDALARAASRLRAEIIDLTETHDA